MTDRASETTRRIAATIRRLRREQEMSAQKLSDRCAELGRPIARNTIANLENGRKAEASLDDIAVIADALGVAVIDIVGESFCLRGGDVQALLIGRAMAKLQPALADLLSSIEDATA